MIGIIYTGETLIELEHEITIWKIMNKSKPKVFIEDAAREKFNFLCSTNGINNNWRLAENCNFTTILEERNIRKYVVKVRRNK